MKKREGKVTKEEWKKWQQAAGRQDALLAQKLLQPCTQYTHDWMHVMCSQGVHYCLFAFEEPSRRCLAQCVALAAWLPQSLAIPQCAEEKLQPAQSLHSEGQSRPQESTNFQAQCQ